MGQSVIKTSSSVNINTNFSGDLGGIFIDKDKNGIPDFVDDLKKNVETSTNIVINGQKYDSPDQVPEQFRHLIPSFSKTQAKSIRTEDPLTPKHVIDPKLIYLAIIFILFYLLLR